MKLNNKELKIVVDEIYKRVSLPIIEKNNAILESTVYADEYTKDVEEYERLILEANKLRDLANSIISKYYNLSEFNGYSFKYKNVPGCLKDYINFQKQKNTKILKYPTKEEIEAKIIISGYSEIPTLIDQIVALYNE